MQELRESRHRIILAHEQTRKEVANLLHAQVQSRLLVLEFWLKDCLELFKDGPEEALERLGNARNILGEIIEQDLRSITRHLYPAIIQIGLPSALNSLAERFHSIFNVEIQVDTEAARIEGSVSSGFDNDLRLTLYRVTEEALTEEALTNVARHSQGDKVTICLGFSSDMEIYLTIEDNGRGFDAARVPRGHGLLRMEDLAGALGGRLEVDSAAGQGTTISVFLPIADGVRLLAKV